MCVQNLYVQSFPVKVWQQKISAILVNYCSFHHVKSLSNNISRGQLGGVAAVLEGQGKSKFASRTDTLVSQAGED